MMLLFDSKKMMLVNEKGQPFALSYDLTPDIFDTYNAIFTLPYIGNKKNFGSSTVNRGFPTKVSFDIVSPIKGYLSRSDNPTEANPTTVGEFNIGTTHFEVPIGATVSLIFFVSAGTFYSGATENIQISVTNIVLED